MLKNNSEKTSSLTRAKTASVHVKNMRAKWSGDPTVASFELKNINLDITSNELVAVVGQIGAGKVSYWSLKNKIVNTNN